MTHQNESGSSRSVGKPVAFNVGESFVILQPPAERTIVQPALKPGELALLRALCCDDGYYLVKNLASNLGFTLKKVYLIIDSLRRRNLIEIRKHGQYRNIEIRTLVRFVEPKCDDVPPNKA